MSLKFKKILKKIRRFLIRFIRMLIKVQERSTGRYLVLLVAFLCTLIIILALGVQRERDYQANLGKVYLTGYEIPKEVPKPEPEHKISDQAIAEMNLSLREREDMVYDMLIAEGFSPAGACGIMGNMSVENENFDPTIEANNGITYGLFQWNDVGNRRTNLIHYCEDRHIHYDTIEGQVYFAIYEIRGGDAIAKKLRSYLETTDDPYTAAMEFTAGFERCVASKDLGQGKYTASIYPELKGKPYQSMNKRISRALNYANRYVSEE